MAYPSPIHPGGGGSFHGHPLPLGHDPIPEEVESVPKKRSKREPSPPSDPRRATKGPEPSPLDSSGLDSAASTVNLLNELQSFLQASQSLSTLGEGPGPAKPKPIPIPSVELTYASIAQRIPRAYTYIYDVYPLQCNNCGFRYEDTPAGKARLEFHLDSHFKKNRRMKEKSKKIISREWFMSEQDWILSLSSVTSLHERQSSSFFSSDAEPSAELGPEGNASHEGGSKERTPVPERITADSTTATECAVCGEPFGKIWDPEADDWLLENVLCDPSTNTIIHVGCITTISSTVESPSVSHGLAFSSIP